MRQIDQLHPEYVARQEMWSRYGDLYKGGETLRRQAGKYLVRRQQEPGDVYSERLQRVFYENYIGSIIDWYAATLFRREPLVGFSGHDVRASLFFREFIDDCDRKGSRISDFFRTQFVDALVYGQSFMLVDFPKREHPARNRAEEDAKGLSRAYLVDYKADQVINWERDDEGRYEWVVLRTEDTKRSMTGDYYQEERWAYYDKENYELYRRGRQADGTGAIELVGRGRHGLAKLRQVPLFEMKVSEGLWLMNRAGLLQVEHFNKSNALSWSLTMGLFAMPVIYSEREFDQMVGDSYYIQLGPQDRFGWTEPEGHVYQVASDNLTRLQEEIYRVCYLLTLGGSSSANASHQSGVSKQRDFVLTQEVLRGYGDVVKATVKRLMRTIAAAREDALEMDVTGMDEFDIGDFAVELDNAERLLRMDIGSQTLTEQVHKRLAFQYLGDFRQEVKDKVAKEIEHSHSSLRKRQAENQEG